MRVIFEHRAELAPGIWHYFFRPEQPVDFVPGQYVDLHLENVQNDQRGKSRTFTLTSLPSDKNISFVVKHFGLQTPYKHVLQDLHEGDSGRIDNAMGDLVLPKSPTVPLVFVAGGIGVSSYASIFKQLLEAREERSIFFFYAMRSRHEQIFRELTDVYPLQLKQLVYSPNRLSAQEIKATTPPEALIYLSGSQKFVEGLRNDLAALGTPHEQIIFDYYEGYPEL